MADKRREPRRKADRDKDASSLMGQGIFTELGTQMVGLGKTVKDLRGSVKDLSDSWQLRYQEAVTRRRRAVVLLGAAIILGMWLNDLHMNTCVVDAYVYQQEPPVICDVSHPMHTHGWRGDETYITEQWPTPWSILGLGIYGTIFMGGVWWYHRPVKGP